MIEVEAVVPQALTADVEAVVPQSSGSGGGDVTTEQLNAVKADVLANTQAINAEKERAEEAEKGIAGNLDALALDVAGLQSDSLNIKKQAARFDGNAFSATANEVKLTTTGVDISKQMTVSLPAATTTTAGVMSAEDKQKVDMFPSESFVITEPIGEEVEDIPEYITRTDLDNAIAEAITNTINTPI